MGNAVATALAAVFGILLVDGTASGENFYQGKTIRIIVGSASGTSYDSYARLAARHLGDHIPGRPTLIVQDMPGAGGITATNYVYNVAPQDGTIIGLFNRNTIVQPFIGNKLARYQPQAFHWLGTPASFQDDPYLFFIRSSLPYQSAEDIRKTKKPLTISDSGDPLLRSLKEALGLNVKVINGYDKPGADLAFARGEVDGTGYGYSNVMQIHPDWFKTNYARAIVQFGNGTRSHKFPNVPTADELALSADDRKIIGFMEAPLSLAFPYAFAPGVPDSEVKILRKAFDEAMLDPAYQADVRQERLSHSPVDGAVIQAQVTKLAEVSAPIIARYNQIVNGVNN